MNQLGQAKWYFAHASVGECIMEGVGHLNASNPGFYQLHGVSADNVPPGSTTAGVIYDDDRGTWRETATIAAIGNGKSPTIRRQ